MQIGKRITHHRMRMNLSQEELAEKVYVSRQSISNWENDKTYPDINSLLLLSRIFLVDLNELVQGDLETMKEIIKKEDLDKFNKNAKLMTIGMILMMITAYPLFRFLAIWGVIIFAIEFLATMHFALKVEKFKKSHDAQTYQQLVAISNGETLDKVQEIEEKAKYPYQKAWIVFGITAIAIVIVLICAGIIEFLTSH